MDVELVEIRDFLASHPPFAHLPPAVLDLLPRALTVRYFRRGVAFPPQDAPRPCLYVIRRGAIELRDVDGALANKLGEGEMCVFPCQHNTLEIPFNGHTVEDTLVYVLSCDDLGKIKADNPAFREHFDQSTSERLRKALHHLKEPHSFNASLMTLRVGDLVPNRMASAPPQTSIQEVARIMSDERVSSLLIMEQGHLLGIVTLRDLRSRCLAVGLPYHRPVREIMTEKLQLIDPETPAFEALIMMTQLNLHHLPVVDGERVLGILSTTDLVRQQSANTVYLVGDIFKARDVAALAQIGLRLPELQVHLVASGASAEQVGQAITAVHDALTKRLLQLAETRWGVPPLPYVWIACGSQARREQICHSDQDNALILADMPDPAQADYFTHLSEFVCDGLAACGFLHCPAEVMASNPRWRQSLEIWRRTFSDWIEQPDPGRLAQACVFFDLRAIAGEESLLNELQTHIARLTQGNQMFLAHMMANSLKRHLPLGFFRNFVLIAGGDHANTLDLKLRGLMPLIDVVRVMALAAGSSEVSTLIRLRQAAQNRALSQETADNLSDAFEFIGTLRVQHQVRLIRNGQIPDNYLAPSDLVPLERSHLKEAFSLIAMLQEALGQRYQATRFKY